MTGSSHIYRRDFLQLAGLGVASLALRPEQFKARLPAQLPDFPVFERLGRVCVGKTEIKTQPDSASATVEVLYEDGIVPWVREIVGQPTSIYAPNVRWVETDRGYIWAPHVQPVKNRPQTPLSELPVTSLGDGMWAEVTVPYVDLALDNPPARSPWLKDSLLPRLHYSQILWVDQIMNDSSGNSYYRLNERYGYGDILWASADAFRPLQDDDFTPINPDAENKRVVINLTYQTLSCYEGNDEVYFCRISSGAKFDAQGNAVDKWSTPLGSHPIWRKVTSLHMSGGTTGGGYDLPGIGWSMLFVGNGVAIHSTFWHNNFGVPMSHGCINARPEDAQWIFRWTAPHVTADPGDVTVAMPGGTEISIEEV
jgi:lipoprotein-anchoring transpeptidase ErfK/SrfK